MDCDLPGPSVQGIVQARILEWVATSFSWGSSWPGNRTRVSCMAGVLLTDSALLFPISTALPPYTPHLRNMGSSSPASLPVESCLLCHAGLSSMWPELWGHVLTVPNTASYDYTPFSHLQTPLSFILSKALGDLENPFPSQSLPHKATDSRNQVRNSELSHDPSFSKNLGSLMHLHRCHLLSMERSPRTIREWRCLLL